MFLRRLRLPYTLRSFFIYRASIIGCSVQKFCYRSYFTIKIQSQIDQRHNNFGRSINYQHRHAIAFIQGHRHRYSSTSPSFFNQRSQILNSSGKASTRNSSSSSKNTIGSNLKSAFIFSLFKVMGSVNCKAFSSTKTVQDEDDARPYNKSGTVEKQPEADYIEQVVCNENEIGENEMKQCEIDEDSKVLLVKQNGVLSALGTKCSHYGALLSTGALSDGRIRCPWHGACFNIQNGDIEDFPGLDSIPCYIVNVEQGKVKVRAKRADLQANKRIKDMVKRDPTNETTFIVIGGGPSGGICVETLRQEGFDGRIILVSKENCLPYDRIKLSKAMDVAIDKIEYRTNDFYEEYGIETMTGVEATNVNSEVKTVTLSNGYVIKYDKLYIATGSKARKPSIPGADLKNVVTVREFVDSKYINSILLPDKHVVCLGLSFIGLESAAYCVKKVAKVTVVGRDTIPLRQSFGPVVGERIMRMFESEGVEFKMQTGIKRCIDTDGVLTAVELNDGTQLKCDICIMGTGSSFYTDFLKDSGLCLNADGSIDTNVFLQTNVPDIYAGGDIANAPVFSIANNLATIGHYPLAQYHGHIAGKNMAGNETALKAVPYFWTVLFGKSFRYSGFGVPHETRIVGNLEELKFVAIYLNKEGHVCGMASCQRDPIVSQYAELQSQGKSIHKLELDTSSDPFAWTKTIKPLKA